MWRRYAPEALQKVLTSMHARASQLGRWGDATVARAVSLAFTALRAPITVPMAVFHHSVGFSVGLGVGLVPVQRLILKPLQLLQVASSEGRLIKLHLTEGDGTELGVQPVWVGWNYTVSNIIDLLERHLALQGRKVWVDSLGACHLRLRGNTFEALPDNAQAKDFVLPLVTLAALVQPRNVSIDAALKAVGDGASNNDRAVTPSPDKKLPGSFFVVPANATGNATTLGALGSHPLNLDLSPGVSDLDTPATSPTAASAISFASRGASPFQ